MSARNLLLDSLTARWEKYKAELEICRHDFSEEAVHDFRVAVRRLLSFLELLRMVIQDPKIQKIRRVLKDQLDNLDELRNVQVLLADISEVIHEIPLLQPFQEYLQHKEKKLLRIARKGVKSLKVASLTKRVKKLQLTLEEFKQANLDASLFSVVDEAFAIVSQRYALADPAHPTTIHRVRLAFKKFRYMVESIYPILQGFPADHLKHLHDYQASMGDIQDMEVALQELEDFGKLSSDSYDLEPVRIYYKERHVAALSNFFEDKDKLFTFWRFAPDKSFPQEK